MAYATQAEWDLQFGYLANAPGVGTNVDPDLIPTLLERGARQLDSQYMRCQSLEPKAVVRRWRSTDRPPSGIVNLPDWPSAYPEMWQCTLARLRVWDTTPLVIYDFDVAECVLVPEVGGEVNLPFGAGVVERGWTVEASYVCGYAASSTALTPSGWTCSGKTATATFAAPHGLAVGQPVAIAGTVPAGYSTATTVATVPTSTTLTVTVPVASLAASTTPGTVTALPAVGTYPSELVEANLLQTRALTLSAFGQQDIDYGQSRVPMLRACELVAPFRRITFA